MSLTDYESSFSCDFSSDVCFLDCHTRENSSPCITKTQKNYSDARLNWFWLKISLLFLAVICLTDSTRWLLVRRTPSTQPTRLTTRGTASRMARRINAHPFSFPRTTSAPSRSSASSPATVEAATNRFTTQLMRRKSRRRRPPPAKLERCHFLKILSTSERHFRDWFFMPVHIFYCTPINFFLARPTEALLRPRTPRWLWSNSDQSPSCSWNWGQIWGSHFRGNSFFSFAFLDFLHLTA